MSIKVLDVVSAFAIGMIVGAGVGSLAALARRPIGYPAGPHPFLLPEELGPRCRCTSAPTED